MANPGGCRGSPAVDSGKPGITNRVHVPRSDVAADDSNPVPLGWILLFVVIALGLAAAVIWFVGGSLVGG